MKNKITSLITDPASSRFVVSAFLVFFFLSSDKIIQPTEAHGYMTSPRTRNQYAAEDGKDVPTAGYPPREYCTHCLNTNSGVCGKTNLHNYDNYVDGLGNAMTWNSQAFYTQGEVIIVKSYLDTHHNGHLELRACPNGENPSQECFDKPGNELTFVKDILYGMPKDFAYPERGYYAGGQGGGLKEFEMEFKLPDTVYGNEVMLQYKYITANSCSPPGYDKYFNGENSKNEKIDSSYWTPGLGLCTPPYPNDGTRGTTWPEQFFNCAEVSIARGGSPTFSPKPSPLPTTAKPTVSKPPMSPPTDPPTKSPNEIETSVSCSSGVGKSSWDALMDMEPITYEVSSNPYTLSVQAEGGAAGGGGSVVSESQAYGVMTSAIALASLEEWDTNYEEAKDKFLGYFNGWKKMCYNSMDHSSCQNPKYCDGMQVPCLPGWKHTGDLSDIEGTGAAPDGDVDAIIGMIIAIKAVEDDPIRPDWYDVVRDWADRSCTQFLADNTVLSTSGLHRLLKLGSCWGGWESDGNNPSYHAPGHYRAMRDFQASFGPRSYELPDFGDILSLTDKWNMLIDTSYKFFKTNQCPDTGLVPNWALVQEKNYDSLQSYPGSFSGSGTPQKEFGAEASRTFWRTSFDAIAYPNEAASQALPFLSPLQNKLVENFDPSPLDGWSFFAESTLSGCSPHVDNVFGSWRFNGFIFGPVYSTLTSKIPDQSFEWKNFTQQTMVDKACGIVSNIPSGESYYARSWKIIASMTLNGDLAKIGKLLRSDHGTSSPTLTPAPTAKDPPTRAPTTSSPTLPQAGCCSQNFRDCITWCGTTRESCSACSDVFWITQGQQNCEPRWNECTNDPSSCCKGLTCVADSPHYSQCKYVPGSTPAPVTPSTNSPTKMPSPVSVSKVPTKAPNSPVSGDGCCSLDLKTCGPTLEGYCSENESQCTTECNKWWLPNGERTDCKARWETCNSNSDCCSPATCIISDIFAGTGMCDIGSGTSSPVSSPITPTISPTKSPIRLPTKAPSKSPTWLPTKTPSKSPIKSPTHDGCYSNNFKDCNHPSLCDGGDCGAQSCTTIWLPSGSKTDCTALWGECTGDIDSCCEPAICLESGGYGQCVLPELSNAPTTYPISETSCADDPTFSLPSAEHKTCSWIGEKKNRRRRICEKPAAKINCPQTCGLCDLS